MSVNARYHAGQGLAMMMVVIFLATLTCQVAAKKLTEITEENCEVCVKFINRFIESIDEPTKNSPAKIETAFKKFCATTKKDDNRFCYYVGGTEDSATSILGEISKPVSWSMPADKICMKLYRRDGQICDLRYDKIIDLTNVDLNKLKVKDLKQILTDWEEQCKGCTEKSDFVKTIEELLPKYDAKAAEARAARKTEL